MILDTVTVAVLGASKSWFLSPDRGWWNNGFFDEGSSAGKCVGGIVVN